MKNREGFVSNSSSSSFIVVGASITTEDFIALAKNHYDVDLTNDDLDDGIYSLPDEIKNTSLGNLVCHYDGSIYLGEHHSLDESAGLETDISASTISKIQHSLKEFHLEASIIGGSDY